MSKVSAKDLVKGIKSTLSKRSPEILTGIGIAGMITTTILAVKTTPKAMRLLEERYGDNNGHPIPKKEVIRTCWKCYIPSAVTGAASISCLIGASKVNLKRNAALATAYKLSETMISEYKDAVVDVVGEKKEKLVREKVAENRMSSDPVTSKEVIITSSGNTLCYDYYSGRYFRSDFDKIKKAENEINRLLVHEMYASLNDLYDELELEHTGVGDELGWKLDDGLIELIPSSKLAADGTPCLVIDYNISPSRKYYNFV